MKLDPESSSLENDLIDEVNTLRQELGSLVRELRLFIEGLRAGDFIDLDQLDVAEILEEIIDG